MSPGPRETPAPARHDDAPPGPRRPRLVRRSLVVLLAVLVAALVVAGGLIALLSRSTTTVTPPASTTPGGTGTTTPAPVAVGAPGSVSASPPGGAVPIATGADAQQVVDARPAGSAFVLAAGVHAGFTVVPKTGDRFYAAPGAVLDGGHHTPSAFVGVSGHQTSDNVAVIGPASGTPLVIRDYSDGNQAQVGTIQPAAGRKKTGITYATGWRLQNLEVTGSFSRGITLASGMVVDQCTVVGNGRLGIGGGGSGISVVNSQISRNGVGVSRPGFEAGGIKTVADGILIAHNQIAGNGAPGVWTDVDATSARVIDNVVTGNQIGVHIEISHDVVVAGNQIVSNHKIGVLVIGSDHVTVTRNVLRNNGGGVVAGGIGRHSKRGAERLTDVSVTHNLIVDSGHSGVTQALPAGWTVTYNDNVYVGGQFLWDGHNVTFGQWRKSGEDLQGTSAS